MSSIGLICQAEQAAAVLQPERLRLLEALGESGSASSLARRFSLPRQRLNYHLRELERVGLIQLVEERRKGNCVERVVRATARSYVISPEVLGTLGHTGGEGTDRFSGSYLVAVAARTIRELASLLARAASAGKRIATLTLDTEIRFASAERRAEFTAELTTAIAQLAAKYHDEHAPAGRSFRLIVTSHPKPTDS